MKEAEVKARAYAMPLTNPAYPPGPYRFRDREFMIITYRTDPEKCAPWCRSRSRSRNR
jgi:acetoacetate decarboxylase